VGRRRHDSARECRAAVEESRCTRPREQANVGCAADPADLERALLVGGELDAPPIQVLNDARCLLKRLTDVGCRRSVVLTVGALVAVRLGQRNRVRSSAARTMRS